MSAPDGTGPVEPLEDPAGDLAAELLARTAGSSSTRPARRSSRASRTPGLTVAPVGGVPRNDEATYSGPRPDQRDPMALTDAVAQLINQQNWQERTRLAAALARWADIAGPDVAAHVVAESFDDGVLVLRADSTAWATQMRLLLPTIRTRIDAAIGRGVVADINVRGPSAPRGRGRLRVPGRGPRDTYG
ncbi:MAG: DUF721 domain-containing protein [Candidatus Nanopelagicales bacterium]